MNDNKRLLSTLSMAKKAGKLVLGFDPVTQAIIKKPAVWKQYILLIADDLSPKTTKELLRICDANGITAYQMTVTMDELWFEIGKRVGIVGLADKGFASKMLKENGPGITPVKG